MWSQWFPPESVVPVFLEACFNLVHVRAIWFQTIWWYQSIIGCRNRLTRDPSAQPATNDGDIGPGTGRQKATGSSKHRPGPFCALHHHRQFLNPCRCQSRHPSPVEGEGWKKSKKNNKHRRNSLPASSVTSCSYVVPTCLLVSDPHCFLLVQSNDSKPFLGYYWVSCLVLQTESDIEVYLTSTPFEFHAQRNRPVPPNVWSKIDFIRRTHLVVI